MGYKAPRKGHFSFSFTAGKRRRQQSDTAISYFAAEVTKICVIEGSSSVNRKFLIRKLLFFQSDFVIG